MLKIVTEEGENNVLCCCPVYPRVVSFVLYRAHETRDLHPPTTEFRVAIAAFKNWILIEAVVF